MNEIELQNAFFKQVKERLPKHKALVDEVSELLNISNDAAYRRLRGEKALTFQEINLLSSRFNISLDGFLNLQNGALLFSGNYIDRNAFDFENYLQGIVKQLSFFNAAAEKEMVYHNKDIPIFHHFMFPELAAFKCYFWSRYNLNYPQFNKGQFLIEDFIDIFNNTGRRVADLYLQIPSTEIWNLDCINTTIRQIDYYRLSKVFKSEDDILTVYNCLEKLVDHIEKQVEAGYKFSILKPSIHKARYQVFINEFILGDNTIAVELDGRRMVFLNHNVINYVMTDNEKFVEYTFETLKTVMQKSTLISGIGEKDRQIFFDSLRERIQQKKKLL